MGGGKAMTLDVDTVVREIEEHIKILIDVFANPYFSSQVSLFVIALVVVMDITAMLSFALL